MVFTRQKARAGGNPEYTPITHLGTNIREVRTTNRVVFTQEQTYLFVQQFVQYYQEKEDCELNYHVLGLNESSKEDEMKKPIVTWLVDFTLTKISIHRLLM